MTDAETAERRAATVDCRNARVNELHRLYGCGAIDHETFTKSMATAIGAAQVVENQGVVVALYNMPASAPSQSTTRVTSVTITAINVGEAM